MKRALLFALLVSGCTPFQPDPAEGPSEELGAWYVAVRGCAGCHKSGDTRFGTLSGNERAMSGDFGGGVAYGRNLTPDLRTGIGTWTDDQIAAAIRVGRAADGRLLCRAHPHFSDMGDLEVASIIIQLRSIPPVSHPIPPSTCPPPATP